MSQCNRHKKRLYLNLLFFQFHFPLKNDVCPAWSLIWDCKLVWVSGQLGYWIPFWLWKLLAQSFLMGDSVPVAVFLGLGVSLDCIFWIPAHYWSERSNIRKKHNILFSHPSRSAYFDLSRCGKTSLQMWCETWISNWHFSLRCWLISDVWIFI